MDETKKDFVAQKLDEFDKKFVYIIESGMFMGNAMLNPNTTVSDVKEFIKGAFYEYSDTISDKLDKCASIGHLAIHDIHEHAGYDKGYADATNVALSI